jgi:hypothetical protein
MKIKRTITFNTFITEKVSLRSTVTLTLALKRQLTFFIKTFLFSSEGNCFTGPESINRKKLNYWNVLNHRNLKSIELNSMNYFNI